MVPNLVHLCSLITSRFQKVKLTHPYNEPDNSQSQMNHASGKSLQSLWHTWWHTNKHNINVWVGGYFFHYTSYWCLTYILYIGKKTSRTSDTIHEKILMQEGKHVINILCTFLLYPICLWLFLGCHRCKSYWLSLYIHFTQYIGLGLLKQ